MRWCWMWIETRITSTIIKSNEECIDLENVKCIVFNSTENTRGENKVNWDKFEKIL